MNRREIAVIGGGASGMMAAIAAAEAGSLVTIFERNDRLGRKILVTGNGKCNLGNLKCSEKDYYGGSREFIKNCLEQFGVSDTVSFFKRLGLLVKDRDGYLYPVSGQAASVLDVLRGAVEHLGIRVVTQAKVSGISRKSQGLEVRWDRQRRCFDAVVVACGSQAAPKTGSDGSGYQLAAQLGLKLTEVVPALVQLRCREEYCKAISGVRADAGVRILDGSEELACEKGELQLTDYGISGIPVFQLSRTVNMRLRERPEVKAVIDFFPDLSDREYEACCRERLKLADGRSIEEFFTGMLHKKLMTLFIKLAGLKTNEAAGKADRERIRQVFGLCRCFTLHVNGSNSYDSAQVCAGGVCLSELTLCLEARKAPGVFFAGEVLDVDARCGGYNLQWAWTSGYLAGRAAAGKGAAGKSDAASAGKRPAGKSVGRAMEKGAAGRPTGRGGATKGRRKI